MEMEKRKWVDNGSGEVDGRRKKVKEGEVAPPPLEEEVEEFFAILRRMHDAVKYFEKGDSGDKRHKLTGRWRTALEKEVGVEEEERRVDGVKDGGVVVVVKRGERVEESGGGGGVVLDLNAAPEGDSNST